MANPRKDGKDVYFGMLDYDFWKYDKYSQNVSRKKDAISAQETWRVREIRAMKRKKVHIMLRRQENSGVLVKKTAIVSPRWRRT